MATQLAENFSFSFKALAGPLQHDWIADLGAEQLNHAERRTGQGYIVSQVGDSKATSSERANNLIAISKQLVGTTNLSKWRLVLGAGTQFIKLGKGRVHLKTQSKVEVKRSFAE
jgi:hypothetical protein